MPGLRKEDEPGTTIYHSQIYWNRMGAPMSWAAPLALITASLIAMLSATAPLPLAVIGYFWATLHLIASVIAWQKR